MQRIEQMGHVFVGTVHGQRVHGQIIRPNGKKITGLGQGISGKGRTRNFNHDAERR